MKAAFYRKVFSYIAFCEFYSVRIVIWTKYKLIIKSYLFFQKFKGISWAIVTVVATKK